MNERRMPDILEASDDAMERRVDTINKKLNLTRRLVHAEFRNSGEV